MFKIKSFFIIALTLAVFSVLACVNFACAPKLTPAPAPPPITAPTPSPTPSLTQVPVPTPTPAPPPTTSVEKLGESEYDAEQQIILRNEGPSLVSRVVLRVALVASREPYQRAVLTKISPGNYNKVEDEYGNTFAEFEFSNVNAGEKASVNVAYYVVVRQPKYRLEPCERPLLTTFLQPERWIESDQGEIVALAEQLTKDKLSPCEKARAIWIGNNIKYTGYLAEDKGALFCLSNRGGDCTEFSYLMIALCRAAGIPARLVEGLAYESGRTQLSELKHDWVEIYLPGIEWVPADPTWGRFENKREQYFARMSSDHVIVTTGNPVAKFIPTFHYFEYRYWWPIQEAKVSGDGSWEIRRVGILPPTKPASLLCGDAEYYGLYAVYESWGYDFDTDYDKYSKESLANKWTWFWIGSGDNENQRLYFDRVGNQWKPRTIPTK